MKYSLRLYRRKESIFWQVDCYVEGERGARRRWTTDVIADGEESRREAERKARLILEGGDLKPASPLLSESHFWKKRRRRLSALAKPKTIYFVKASNGLIKIGITRRINVRLSGLRTDSPLPLKLLATVEGHHEDERSLHVRFRHLHSHGEWFRGEQELLEYIALVMSKAA